MHILILESSGWALNYWHHNIVCLRQGNSVFCPMSSMREWPAVRYYSENPLGLNSMALTIRQNSMIFQHSMTCVCVRVCCFHLSVWFMWVHECHSLSLPDQHGLGITQPGHSQLIALDQHCHACRATPQTLTKQTHHTLAQIPLQHTSSVFLHESLFGTYQF